MHIYTSLVQYRISMRLQYYPRDVQTIYLLGPYRIFMHLYVPWAVQDFHASIRPLGHIRFTCIYTSLGPYRIFMHLYVPWAIQDLHASICPQGASGGQYGLIFFANFILYEGCITVGGVYYYVLCRIQDISPCLIHHKNLCRPLTVNLTALPLRTTSAKKRK